MNYLQVHYFVTLHCSSNSERHWICLIIEFMVDLKICLWKCIGVTENVTNDSHKMFCSGTNENISVCNTFHSVVIQICVMQIYTSAFYGKNADIYRYKHVFLMVWMNLVVFFCLGQMLKFWNVSWCLMTSNKHMSNVAFGTFSDNVLICNIYM